MTEEELLNMSKVLDECRMEVFKTKNLFDAALYKLKRQHEFRLEQVEDIAYGLEQRMKTVESNQTANYICIDALLEKLGMKRAFSEQEIESALDSGDLAGKEDDTDPF